MEEEDEIWYECQICYVLLFDKDLIENHIGERHPEVALSIKEEIDDTDGLPVNLSNIDNITIKQEVDPDMEVTETFGIKKTDDDEDNETESQITYKYEIFWEEVKISEAIVQLEDCVKTMKLPIKATEVGASEKYICYTCYKVCYSKQDLYKHRKTHNGEKRFICKVCSKLYAGETQFKIHELEHSDDWPILSQNKELYAEARRKIMLDRRKHRMTMYVYPKKLQCPYCPQSLPYESRMKIHLRQHTKDRPFKCETCESTYRTAFSLRQHLEKNTCKQVIEQNLARIFQCTLCNGRLKSEKGLIGHMRHMHKITRPRQTSKEHICLICGYNAGCPNTLNRHIRSHTGEKPFKCPYCHVQFSIKNNMEKHMAYHCKVAKERNIIVKKFEMKEKKPPSAKSKAVSSIDPKELEEKGKKCNFIGCDEMFLTAYQLRLHERIHGDKCPCTFCPSSYANKMGLAKHLQKKHKDQLTGHKCDICNTILATRHGLNMHCLSLHDCDPTFIKKNPADGKKKGKSLSSSASLELLEPVPDPLSYDYLEQPLETIDFIQHDEEEIEMDPLRTEFSNEPTISTFSEETEHVDNFSYDATELAYSPECAESTEFACETNVELESQEFVYSMMPEPSDYIFYDN